MEGTDIKKWDLVMVDLKGAIGSEQKNKRPCLVISNDIGNKFSPIIIVLPFTSEMKKLEMPTHTLVQKNQQNGLKMDSMLLAEQPRTVDKRRVIRKLGKVSDSQTKRKIVDAFKAAMLTDE